MLTLIHTPGALRRAQNLLPFPGGGMATRPGAVQVLSGPIDRAAPWGDKVLVQRAGALYLWDGTTAALHALGAAGGSGLSAAPYQALVAGEREDRLYVADGTPLWYVRRTSAGSYERRVVVNAITDPGGLPYATPAGFALTTWRERLWVATGGSRLYHCQANLPDQWDPLWYVDLQGPAQEAVQALMPAGDRMLVGTTRSVWALTGTTQYNWERDQVVQDQGVAGLGAAASDGVGIWWVAPQGVRYLAPGKQSPKDLSTRVLDPIFEVAQAGAELVLTPDAVHALVLLAGRLLVLCLGTGKWGEIDTNGNAQGLVRLDARVGWWGADGLWVLSGRDMPDSRLDGTSTDVASVLETWDTRPNPDGRSVLSRVYLELLGSARSPATYTALARAPGVTRPQTWSVSLTLADPDQTAPAFETWEGPVHRRVETPVLRDLAPRLPGETFAHRLESACYLELRDFRPQYRTGAPPDPAA